LIQISDAQWRHDLRLCRVSIGAQDLTSQLAELEVAGCEKIFREKITGTTTDRPQLAKLMAALTPGDVVITPAVDRLSRAGSYLRVKGIAKGTIDTAALENSGIADLDKAPRNAHGMAKYETDFIILRPAEPSRTSGILVYDVTNRGRKMIFNLLDDASANADTNNPKTAQDVGLGFTLGRGYSLVWSGWDSGAPRSNNGMTARLPPTLENGNPMVRRVRDEFHIGTRAPGKGDIVRLDYPAVSTDQREGRLTVRARESDSRAEIPADCWEFVDRQSIQLLPVGSHFAPYKIYKLWYEATGSSVLGVGFAATRDLLCFLRYEPATAPGRSIR
jgi:Resolvase, N terminal domain